LLAYDMPLYRPPSEGRSVIIQATLGCSHNKCSFCAMYRTKRFAIRPFEDVERDIQEAARFAPHARRIFLADGDALVIPTPKLLPILECVRKHFPYAERITSYALPRNLLKKSVDELRQLREAGLTMLYYGVETGDPTILEKITKGGSAEEMIAGCDKAHEAGMQLSTTIILGLGGRKYSEPHIENTARLLSRIEPAYVGALVLTMVPIVEQEFHEKFGEPFEALTIPELLDETGRLVEGMEVRETVFRSNHASNYLPIGGVLSRDREELLRVIERAKHDPRLLRPEWSRGL
jgi:radical SAM superfamily enzyme YgiQ (UPF0313 family)